MKYSIYFVLVIAFYSFESMANSLHPDAANNETQIEQNFDGKTKFTPKIDARNQEDEDRLLLFQKKILNTKVPNDKTKEAILKEAIDDLVYVEGGRYTMGDVTGDWDRYYNNKHAHNVTLSGFWISKHKITLNDYLLYIKYNERVKNYPIRGEEDRDNALQLHRVRYRSIELVPFWDWALYIDEQLKHPEQHYPAFLYWNEADFYCQWLAEETGLPFSLPTEAQWEFVARNRGELVKYATDNGELDYGVNIPTQAELFSYTNFSYHPEFGYGVRYHTPNVQDANSNSIKSRLAQSNKPKVQKTVELLTKIQPIGLYPPNPLGIYDLTYSGYEWMSDWYEDDYYKHSPEFDPKGGEPYIMKSLRGMDWRNRLPSGQQHQQFGTNVTRNRMVIRWYNFPHGYTARCVVNSDKPLDELIQNHKKEN